MMRAVCGPALLSLAALAWGQAASPAKERYASVTGVVLDEATGTPLVRAVVKLSGSAASLEDIPEAVAWTDGSGAFSFFQIPPGRYTLYPTDKGYSFARSETVSLASGEQRHFVLRLRRVGSISGTVTDLDGDPLADVRVLVLDGKSRSQLPRGYSRQATTDDRGRYYLQDLQAGKYRLAALAYGRRPPQRSEAVRGQPAEEPACAMQFYLNADRVSSAARFALQPGQSLDGLNFRLSPQPVTRIEGGVIAPPETPPDTRIRVQAALDETLGYGPFYSAEAGRADGAFELKGLFWGRYVLYSEVTVQGRSYCGVEHVEAGRNPGRVTIRLEPLAEVSGTVHAEGDSGVIPKHVRLRLVRRESFPFSPPSPEADVGPDGAFRFEGVPAGVWNVDTGWSLLEDGWIIQSMRLGDLEVPPTGMTLRPGTNTLSVFLSPRGAVVEGQVERPKAHILLAPVAAFGDTRYYDVIADESGHFEMSGIQPGAYRLYALDRLDDHTDYPDLVESLGDAGEAVQLAAGDHVSRQLRLTRAPEVAK